MRPRTPPDRTRRRRLLELHQVLIAPGGDPAAVLGVGDQLGPAVLGIRPHLEDAQGDHLADQLAHRLPGDPGPGGHVAARDPSDAAWRRRSCGPASPPDGRGDVRSRGPCRPAAPGWPGRPARSAAWCRVGAVQPLTSVRIPSNISTGILTVSGGTWKPKELQPAGGRPVRSRPPPDDPGRRRAGVPGRRHHDGRRRTDRASTPSSRPARSRRRTSDSNRAASSN